MISGLSINFFQNGWRTDLFDLAIGKSPEEENYFVCAYFVFV